MEELFRFVLARPAQKRAEDEPVVRLEPTDELHRNLKVAREDPQAGTALRRVAREHSESPGVPRSAKDLKHGAAVAALHAAFAAHPDMKLPRARKRAEERLGALDKVTATADWKSDRRRLADSLVVNSLLGFDVTLPSSEAAGITRTMALVKRLATKPPPSSSSEEVGPALEAALLLPPEVFPVMGRRGADPDDPAPPPEDDDRREELVKRRDRLRATYAVLTRVSPDHLELPAPVGSGEDEQEERHARPDRPPALGQTRDAKRDEEREPEPPQLPGSAARLSARSRPLRLKREVVEQLGPEEREVLAERGMDLTVLGVPDAADRLSAELHEVEVEVARMLQPPVQPLIRSGSNLIPVEATAATSAAFDGLVQALDVPTTFGSLTPAGIGDLLVVRQFLKRYEGRELAHIENVLKGEHKSRLHRRARTTEETVALEVVTEHEEERDQQSTERFELRTEASEVVKQDMSLNVGLAVSGKYGPVVEFKASTDFALNTSKEQATKVATAYSKEVTTRAASRVFDRRREERILKTIEVFEERNRHGIDNKDGGGHVVGQYQWVDKVYEAQVFNFGKRLLFDLMLPEPAAFLLHALGTAPKAGADLVKPPAFTLTPADISEWNYRYYVRLYEAVGVNPPPLPYLTVAKALEGTGTRDAGTTKAMEVPVPDGYEAISGFVSAWFNRWSGGMVDVALGQRMNRFSDNGGWWPSLSYEAGAVPLTLKTLSAEAYAVGVEVIGQRTQRALDDWKLKTHATILQAYQKQLRDYEERLAALEVQASQQFEGRNPAENERLIRAELKKGAISAFTAQHYDLFGAITTSPQGYPQPDLPEAALEGKYIRFFEQAFEWEQMMFFFYPYYWGRKPNWTKRALLQDTDPMFAEFLKAGSARVVVSVRPGFEQAMAHFLDTGEVWDGGDLPPITSPLYLSVIDEIRERDKAPGTELAQGLPWDVRLPTTLVRLREKAALPAWTKKPNGEWVPV
ncbi:MAG TPA: hypothetical protein VHG69_06675 [Thermoleophilaceae bacterium]|nr:hypothetical protein [Thermoleophilaceae bacterium]